MKKWKIALNFAIICSILTMAICIQVKTVDEGHYKEYDQTIAFYEGVGFKKMEVFPTLWDEWNPCLILIKKI